MALFDDIFKIKTQTSTGLFSASNPWRAASEPGVSVAPSEKGLAPIRTPKAGCTTEPGTVTEGKPGARGKRRSDGVSHDGNPREIGLPKKNKKKSKGSEVPLPPEGGPVSTSPSKKAGTSGTSGKLKKKAKISDPIPAALNTRADETHGGLPEPGVSKSKPVKPTTAAPNRDVTGAQPLGSPQTKQRGGKKRKAGDDAAPHSQATNRGIESESALSEEGGDVATDAAVSAGPPAKKRRTAEEEAERLGRTIFIGNLPASITRSALKKRFKKYGDVESVRLRSVAVEKDVKMPRKAAILSGHIATERGSAHAYLVFNVAESVQPALRENMQEWAGRHIRVDRAAGSRLGKTKKAVGVHYDSARSVFVGNLPFDIEDEQLIQLFNKCVGGAAASGAGVTAVRVVRDGKTNAGKGIAFVEFGSKHGALMAIAQNGTMVQNRALRVTRVKSGTLPSRATSGPRPQSKLATKFNKEKKLGPGGSRAAPAEASQWQGFRTKGKLKLTKSAAATAPKPEQAKPGGAGGVPCPQGKKRPAVAARKAAATRGGGGGTPVDWKPAGATVGKAAGARAPPMGGGGRSPAAKGGRREGVAGRPQMKRSAGGKTGKPSGKGAGRDKGRHAR